VQHSLPFSTEEQEDPWIAILRGRSRREIELDPATEEYVVTVAASVAQHFVHRDRAVGMVAYGQTREVLQPDRGHRQLTKVLETLAMLRAQGEIPLAQVLLSEGERLGRGVTLVAITPSLDRTWVAAARDLSRRGVRMVAIVVDPESFGGAGAAEDIIGELQASSMPTYLAREGDDLSRALSQQMSFSRGSLGRAKVAAS
jgi:uncharacterized protein (DUF58 family)